MINAGDSQALADLGRVPRKPGDAMARELP